MALPFLQPKKMSAVIIAKMKPEGNMETVAEEGEHSAELMEAAESLIRAIHSKDASAVASALKEAFQVTDSEPHVEGEHLGE